MTARLLVVVLAFGCGGSSSGAPPCGDGQVDDGEACDDGNAADRDGCSSRCVVEQDFRCDGEPSICKKPCTIDADCADPNECTDDRCGEDGTCVFANNTAICDDGVFCNGLDRCVEGACANHA